MNKPKILYVEDDASLAFLTKDILVQHNFEVYHYSDGETAFENFHEIVFDLCLLDIMVPKKDGFALAEAIRELNTHIPIIFLSAKTLQEDRIKGLRLGADDYLIKPFSIEELLLKIDIFLKRNRKLKTPENTHFQIGKYQFDPQNYCLWTTHEKIKLTQRESDLLKFLLENKNVIIKREDILKKLWGTDDYFLGRSLDVFISRLRKIVTNETGITIETIHGIGFRFSEE